MPPKSRNKVAIGKKFLSKSVIPLVKVQNAQHSEPQEFGLRGSNMHINIRVGSSRTAEDIKSAPPIGVFKSEDCLFDSISTNRGAVENNLSIRSSHKERPATAGNSLSSRRTRRAFSRRRASSSSNSREEKQGRKLSNWTAPSISQSNEWSSSADCSECATVGSCETVNSFDEKQSFAVFSSFSFDSRDEGLQTNAPPTERMNTRKSATGSATAKAQLTNVGSSKCAKSSERSSSPMPFETVDDNQSNNPTENLNEETLSDELQEANMRCRLKNNVKSTPLNSSRGYLEDDTITALADESTSSPTANSPQQFTTSCKPEELVNKATPRERSSVSDRIESDHNDEAAIEETINKSLDTVAEFKKAPLIPLTVRMAEHSEVCSDHQKQFHGETRPDETAVAPSEGKNMLSDLWDFLDSATVDQPPAGRFPSQVINSETESSAENCEKINKLRCMTLAEMTEEILSLQMLVRDKEQQRELLARSVKLARREFNLRCKSQKEEYETTLKRHVLFIQQLVDEKKKLAEKYEALCQQNSRAVYERKIIEERHSAEIRRLKQTFGKDQRFKQEKWVADRTEHIREATARGLEPELRRLMNQHQIELQSLRSIHQEELLRSEQAHNLKTSQQLNALREKMEHEREEACLKEREIMRNKSEKQMEEAEQLNANKLQRLQAEMDREKARWVEETSRWKTQMEEDIRRNEEKFRREKAAAQQLFKAEMETLKQQHAEQLLAHKQKFDHEKKEALEALRHALDMKFKERERQLVESLRKEREDHIQEMSRQMVDDVKHQQASWKELSEQQLQRMREKHSEELASLDKSENELRNKLMEMRRLLTDRDEELTSLRLTLFQHVKENKEIKKSLDKYTVERSDLRKILQKELEEDFRKQDEEKRMLQEEFAQLKSEYRSEINKKNAEVVQLTASHEKMLNAIHEKVKQAVSKKDEAMVQLQEKLKVALHRSSYLEELLDRQSLATADILSGRKNF